MKIKNETLKKLTAKEAQELDLFSIGCMFVRGEAKARVKNWKTVLKSENEMHYSNGISRVELVRLDSTSEFDGVIMKDWCVRVYNEQAEKYDVYVAPIFAINFVK